MNSFYWGSKRNGSRGINWMRWDKLSLHKTRVGLGFRDIEAFNLSMLGKQGWKLLTEPSSLLTRILKAKYFPRRDFLVANIGHNPSYTWRSIWSSQDLIKSGYRWRIDDGSRINVWNTPWIRSLPTLRPSTIPPPFMGELLVQNLVNLDRISWNNVLVHAIFNYNDAAAILAIPLRNRNLVDSYVWQFMVDGSYSVKLAYSHCISLETNVTDAAVPNQNRDIIWKQKVPPKVRSFLWRASHNYLPTRSRLIQKGIPCSESCVHCDVSAETHTHLFFVSAKAVACWELLQLDDTIRNMLPTANDFSTLLFYFFDRLNTEK